ncbi:Trichosetin biosynthesis cluster transcription factor tf23 [Conoideocrella luteorostrata]|uniref:Trichosetin biosynthesis cluster transcription factor tf23 n=1 Tax=Conoideocrella luteorostrata TaxID=1105319 RepID=A0AAJ0CZZ9_9HYPO|nr:Trichosetin biosynthesis cluster transcription factor tf23 [Conoideocrella luteorostrata]
MSSRELSSSPPVTPGPSTVPADTCVSTPAVEVSADDCSASSDFGSMRFTNSGTSYVHGAHWAAILDEIAELKDHFEKEDKPQPGSQMQNEPSMPHWTGPQLLYGCSMLPTKQEIIASLPARPVVDRLISRYFNSFEMSPAVLHSVQFLKEYDDFWVDPCATPITWLALLFTLMCLATQFQVFRLDPSDQVSTVLREQDLKIYVSIYRQRVVQCLVLGDYTKGGPYVLETLMLYMAVELFLRNDAEIGNWILLGTIVQLALHMGYHRDPKRFKNISAFEGEMRKRIWATVVELDLGISAQMGLPRLIKQWQADAPEPLNLQDSDFNKATVVMPPSRPETDLTPMLYRIVKARLMTAIGYIWDFAADSRTYTHVEIMDMNKRLQDAHASIPEQLRWQSMAHCITNSPQLIMQKIFLEIMFQRARIVLHRRYLHGFPDNTDYNYSQEACLDAALTLLDYQQMLQDETQPFCQLYQERWKVSSLVNHDFLLAISVLCLYLKQPASDGEAKPTGSIPNETILGALKRSYYVWLSSSGSSKEALEATRALRLVLGIPRLETQTRSPLELQQQPTSPDINAASYCQGFEIEFPAVTFHWPELSVDTGIDWQMMGDEGP